MKFLREMRFCQRSSAAYKSHLNKLEKDITTFLNEFVPGNLLHISKLKSYENDVQIIRISSRSRI